MTLNKENELIIEIANLRKSFGNQTVLRNMNLKIQKGEFVAIVGKSGCGKSTLLRLLAGLELPSDGAIYTRGHRLEGRNVLAKMMFQDGRLLPWKKVIQNVGLGLSKDWKERAERILENVGLQDRADDWPSVLSGGQKQRVALARALVHEPEILLLDEPLGALDALTRIEMHQLIENLWLEKQFTAVLVTHDVEEAVALANRVILIENGEIVMDHSIKLPYPRQRDHPSFSPTVSQILNRIMKKDKIANTELRLTKIE
ncbi:ATP-binding cassette domain-containing protein [Bacillus sp. BRMEA1]|uniref:ATP-binding cassette domain-containing protein n=1 Tax=Neobacillus endophyticus TaxID=2738405 RepID=UPI0015631436|nr:ATP-binding cassette domain-containing protein [Neobacillus endophyticus]NRD79112.1 ATP-binding cassette domain-containing protein [Neobacillus endophyticus]